MEPTAPPRRATHPLATAAIILSCAGFAIPVVSGLVGALLGALALQAIARASGRWNGAARARTALGLGLLTGAMPLGVIALFHQDEWGVAPVVLLVAYAAMVAAIGFSARPGDKVSAGRVVGGAAMGAGGVVVAGVVLIGLVLAVVFLFQTMISGIADAIGNAACGGS